MASKSKWLPLESNPDVMNKYVANLGVGNVPGKFQFVDVYGLDPDILATVPQPALAVLLLFPCNEKHEAYVKQEEAKLKGSKQKISESLYFTKQTVGNACGTVALLHALLNNTEKLALKEGGKLQKFLNATKKMKPEERAKYMETEKDVSTAHEEAVQEGQTEVIQKVDWHFAAFVEKQGNLYELDGEKAFPINHGPSSGATLLKDAAKVCKQFMERDPSEVHFTIIALTAST